MRLLPSELVFWVSLIASIHPIAALPHVSVRDSLTPCTGDLAPLNTKGMSPGSIYQQLQDTCNRVDNPNASLCRCNLIAFNLNMASMVCQQLQPPSWPEWAQSNLCTSDNSTTGPLDEVPYDTSSISIPNWAHQTLSVDHEFNLAAALKEAKGWTEIQIVVPVIVGVGVLILSAIAFFFYRRHKKKDPPPRKRRRKAWQNAHLHGPRRFFGLIPNTLKVRSRDVREPQWEIDENNALSVGVDADFQPPLNGHAQRVHAGAASMHSRTTSVTSLLSGSGSSSSHPTSEGNGFFASLASKFSALSLSRNYQSGATKGPDYKRVQVLPREPDRQFKIDGALASPAVEVDRQPEERWAVPPAAHPVPPETQPQSPGSTLPSVFDIRRHTTTTTAAGGGGTATSASRGRNGMFALDDLSAVEFTSPVQTRSDYSLGTSDLQTPVTPSRDAAAAGFAPRYESKVSPGSPLLPSARYANLNALTGPDNSSTSRVQRNQSTDTLAYELYPRRPG